MCCFYGKISKSLSQIIMPNLVTCSNLHAFTTALCWLFLCQFKTLSLKKIIVQIKIILQNQNLFNLIKWQFCCIDRCENRLACPCLIDVDTPIQSKGRHQNYHNTPKESAKFGLQSIKNSQRRLLYSRIISAAQCYPILKVQITKNTKYKPILIIRLMFSLMTYRKSALTLRRFFCTILIVKLLLKKFLYTSEIFFAKLSLIWVQFHANQTFSSSVMFNTAVLSLLQLCQENFFCIKVFIT